MNFSLDRRSLGKSAAALAFAGLANHAGAALARSGGGAHGYGALVPDPAGLIDLPPGFSYRVVSAFGQPMDDGDTVPDNADGMGCFRGPDGLVILVRNHELKAREHDLSGRAADAPAPAAYDRDDDGRVLAGGTTTLWVDPASGEVRRQFRSLYGTIRNCAGGTTPWGTWLTCEEDVTRAGKRVGRDHGWIFEVPAMATAPITPEPLRAMGRFNHEAAAVDPRTGIVYLTEDRDDGLLYRFIPAVPGALARGGRLQALSLGKAAGDTRNWSGANLAVGRSLKVRWVDLDDVESPADDLRHRGAAAGAATFARGEGIHMGQGELYVCCTSGGAAKMGQVFRLRPSRSGGKDRLELFFESRGPEEFNFGDNLTVGPKGNLFVCEDQYTDVVDNYVRIITPEGRAFPFGRLRTQTELAGACFSPDGRTMFVNCFSPTKTLMIQGPW